MKHVFLKPSLQPIHTPTKRKEPKAKDQTSNNAPEADSQSHKNDKSKAIKVESCKEST